MLRVTIQMRDSIIAQLKAVVAFGPDIAPCLVGLLRLKKGGAKGCSCAVTNRWCSGSSWKHTTKHVHGGKQGAAIDTAGLSEYFSVCSRRIVAFSGCTRSDYIFIGAETVLVLRKHR